MDGVSSVISPLPNEAITAGSVNDRFARSFALRSKCSIVMFFTIRWHTVSLTFWSFRPSGDISSTIRWIRHFDSTLRISLSKLAMLSALRLLVPHCNGCEVPIMKTSKFTFRPSMSWKKYRNGWRYYLPDLKTSSKYMCSFPRFCTSSSVVQANSTKATTYTVYTNAHRFSISQTTCSVQAAICIALTVILASDRSKDTLATTSKSP